jgi:aryl-alcohol dehydrogenase-like predicted oxidoreductase
MPRFAADNLQRNRALLDGLRTIAAEHGCTPAQLALAWLLAQGDDVIPIPGTTRIAHLRENLAAAELRLDAQALARLNALVNEHNVAGARYGAATQAEIDTEDFPAASR